MDTATWLASVEEAARDDDAERLGDLFSRAENAWGRAEASRRWLAALSGFDSSAITG